MWEYLKTLAPFAYSGSEYFGVLRFDSYNTILGIMQGQKLGHTLGLFLDVVVGVVGHVVGHTFRHFLCFYFRELVH